MSMLMVALALATCTVSPESEALGLRLARTGTLAILLPLIVAKETEELVASQSSLNDADKAQLRALATHEADFQIQRIMAVEGHAYASTLSLADLEALLVFSETDLAGRFRATQPKVIAATMQGIAGVDFKKDVLAGFCKTTGKGCPAK